MRAFYSSVIRIMQLVFVALVLLSVWAVWHNSGGTPAQAGQAISAIVSGAFGLLEQLFSMLVSVLGGLL